MQRHVKSAILSLAIAAASPAAATTNLVTNGSFDTDMSGWVVTKSNPHMLGWRRGWPGVARTGWGDNSLSQAIATDPGRTYTLSFRLSTGYRADAGAYFRAWFGDGKVYEIVNDPEWATRGWPTLTFTGLTATGSSSILRFDAFSDWGEVSIDDVSLTADAPAPVPEPAAWAMMIAGFGAIGATVRRRRKPAGASLA